MKGRSWETKTPPNMFFFSPVFAHPILLQYTQADFHWKDYQAAAATKQQQQQLPSSSYQAAAW